MHATLQAALACIAVALVAFSGAVSAQEPNSAAQTASSVDCEQLRKDLEAKSSAFAISQETKRNEFYDSQHVDRERHWSENHTDEERADFEKRQTEAAQAFEIGMAEESRLFHDQLWQDYLNQCGSSHSTEPMPAYDDPWANLSEECKQKFYAASEDVQAFVDKWAPRWQDHETRFAAESQSFAQSDHTAEEWKAFGARWDASRMALYDEMRADLEALVAKHDLKSCVDQMGGLDRFLPFGHYASSNMPPPIYPSDPPQDDPYYEEDQMIRDLRTACEEKVQAVMASASASGDESSYRALKERIMQIQEECENAMRAHYESFYAKDALPTDRMGEMGSFHVQYDEATDTILVTGKHVSLIGIPAARMITKVTVNGQLYIDQLYVIDGFLADFRFDVDQAGSALNVFAKDGSRILAIHDVPTGAIQLDTAPAAGINKVMLNLADYLKVEDAEKGVQFSSGDAHGRVLRQAGATERGLNNELTLSGSHTFLVANLLAADETDSEVEQAIMDKILDQKVGATVTIAEDGDEMSSSSTSYGDLEIKVEKKDHKLSARVESKRGEGKTVVFKLDKKYSESELKIKIFEVLSEGREEEAPIKEADDLEDVLDPTNDDGIEYLVVKDTRGAKLLVSFPHFSEKRVDVETIGTSIVGPAIPGFDAALLGLATIGVAVALARRPGKN